MDHGNIAENVQFSHCDLPSSYFADGLDVVDKIESVGSQSGKTSKSVIVKDCGEVV